MIKTDTHRVNIRDSPSPYGGNAFPEKSDFIRLLSALIIPMRTFTRQMPFLGLVLDPIFLRKSASKKPDLLKTKG